MTLSTAEATNALYGLLRDVQHGRCGEPGSAEHNEGLTVYTRGVRRLEKDYPEHYRRLMQRLKIFTR